MARDVLYKTLLEKVPFAIDFTADVPSGGTIATNGVTATAKDSAGNDATAILIGTITFSGTIVTVQLKATTLDKETYVVRVRAIMSDSLPTVAERIVEVRVRDNDTVE